MAFDKLYLGVGVLVEGWPKSSADYIIRSIVISISTLAMLWSLTSGSRPKLILDERNGVRFERFSILGVMSASVVFLFLFIFSPLSFNTLSMEDGFIEWASAILLFGSCIVSAISFSKTRNASGIPRGTQLSLAILSLVFFVIAMEEVSWFQRVLEIETPKAFEGNYQKEMNLHNFATNKVENIYYFSTFIFLVLLPFIRLMFPFVSNNNYLKLFVARPFIGIIGSIACAYNFDMWNIIFTQIAFFGSVAILFSFLVFSSNRNDKYIISFTIIFIISTQLLFLSNGINFVRLWEVTEYKEFFIPLVFFIYSLDMFLYIKRVRLSDKS